MARPDPPAGGSGSMRAGLIHHASKPLKRHNGQLYWLTHDVAFVFARLCPPGRILGTQTFRAARVFAFYLHKLFGLPSPSHLHFTYTNFSDGRGFAL